MTGRWLSRQAEKLVFDGADIIDVEGSPHAPGMQSQLGRREELERVLPVIRLIHENFDIPISVDTYKEQGGPAGLWRPAPPWSNDIWGLKKNKDMAGTIC